MTEEPARLVSIPEAPVPDHGKAEWFRGADGATLRAATFFPDGPARGTVVLSPGRSEPLEKYFEVVDDLLARGFELGDLILQPLGEIAGKAFQGRLGLGDGGHVDAAPTAHLELEHVRHLDHFSGLIRHGRLSRRRIVGYPLT
mgnify:CR=1 FL=1